MTRLSKYMNLSLMTIVALIFSSSTLASTINGSWQMLMETDAFSGEPTLRLESSEGKLVAELEGQTGVMKGVGNIDGQQFSITFELANHPGDLGAMVFSGSIKDDVIEGNISLGQWGSGSFMGERIVNLKE